MGRPGWPTKAKLITIPIYNVEVWWVPDVETYQACLEAVDCQPPSCAGINGRVTDFQHKKTGDYFILLSVFNGCTDTLVHEIGHCAFRILEAVGVKVDPVDEETLCYLMGYLWRVTSPELQRANGG
jgi:hypothetical protein